MRSLDRHGIEALLPHRGASLLLHAASLMPPEGSAEARLAADHPMLPGHFPHGAIVPGVLLLEAAAQLGGLIIACGEAEPGFRLGVLAAVRKALFHSPLYPGETLFLTAGLRRHQDFALVTAEGRRDAQKIVTCELVLAPAPAAMPAPAS